jgi:hypothetical protein
MYDLVRIDPMYLDNIHQFVEEVKRHANRQNKNDIFCPCVDYENKIVPRNSMLKNLYLKW